MGRIQSYIDLEKGIDAWNLIFGLIYTYLIILKKKKQNTVWITGLELILYFFWP